MARYRKLDLRTWNDQKFRALSPLKPSGQGLWLYLILGPQSSNIPGLFEASEVALADRLGWSLEAFREAFREAFVKGMAKADWKARLVWLPRAPEYNRPESPNVVISWASTFDELPECPLKWEAYHSLKAFAEGLPDGFREAFGKAFPKSMPNQEQEQEQKQEQESEKDIRPAANGNGAAHLGELEANSPSPMVVVFEHWRTIWQKPKAKLDPKRQKIIRTALKTYPPETLCESIGGYRKSDFHMGKNDSHTVYGDIETMLRDAKHIEAGLRFAEQAPERKWD
jgi:hypothetical protein